ncbi:AraC family transcriptional regulator [Actinophytocola sediminis]
MIDFVVSNEDVAVADRAAHLRELMSQTRAPMDIGTTEPTELALYQRDLHLDQIRMWSMEFDPVTFFRTREQVRQSDPETYNICLLRNGEMTYAADRQEVAHSPGDLLVHDLSRPFGLRADSTDGQVNCVGLEIPKAMVALPRNQADHVAGRRIPARDGIGALLAGFLTRLTTDTIAYRPADAPRLAIVVADLVSALFAHIADSDAPLPPAESHRQLLTMRIKAYIRNHLGDPTLTRETIAAAHHISTSYLHRLFQDDGIGVMAWIRQQRLEHARRDLADPEWNTAPIHQIATRWGFTHHADFTRAFRNAHQIPPREYRRMAQLTAER